MPRKVAIGALVWSSIVASTIVNAADQAGSCRRLYVFGDSYSDSGRGYLDGNGPTAVVYFAHELGLILVPSDLGGKEDSLNFAVSGAKTGRGAGRALGRALLEFGMQNQVDEFVAKVRDGSVVFAPDSTVFFLAGGLNDKATSTAQITENLEQLITRLHSAGARRFVLARIPITLINPDVGARLNPELVPLAATLRRKLADAHVDISDWGLFFDRVYAEGERRGFRDMKNECAGRSIFRQDPTPCASPQTHFYYHHGHPSTEVHRQVGALLTEEALANWCSEARR